MAGRKKTPDRSTLLAWIEEGLTAQQMADRHIDLTGEYIARSTIQRELTRHREPREYLHQDTIPWQLQDKDVGYNYSNRYPAMMLRALGKRLQGRRLSDAEEQKLTTWLQARSDAQDVVAFDPSVGLFYVPRLPTDDPNSFVRLSAIATSDL